MEARTEERYLDSFPNGQLGFSHQQLADTLKVVVMPFSIGFHVHERVKTKVQ